MPADVLFVGEAPGRTEDTFGIPFVGPAGDCLNRIITLVCAAHPHINNSIGISNMVCCIPRDVNGDVRKPEEEEVWACSSRLQSLIEHVSPNLIVAVGEVARDSLDTFYELPGIELCDIVHPASIIRGPLAGQTPKVHMAASTIISALDFLAEV